MQIDADISIANVEKFVHHVEHCSTSAAKASAVELCERQIIVLLKADSQEKVVLYNE